MWDPGGVPKSLAGINTYLGFSFTFLRNSLTVDACMLQNGHVLFFSFGFELVFIRKFPPTLFHRDWTPQAWRKPTRGLLS